MIKHFRRRHGFKGTEPNIKEYFTRLDPRDCNLDLDEETMTTIFGPAKNRSDEILVGDFVTLTNIEENKELEVEVEVERNDTLEEEKSQTDDEKSTESEPVVANDDGKIVIKVEPAEPPPEPAELEPTDFVSVKIESMDEEN